MKSRRRLAWLLATMALAIVVASGVALAATLKGTSAVDNIDGTAGDDNIYGYEGDDTMRGLAGYDYIDAGPGKDVVHVSDEKDFYDEHLNRTGSMSDNVANGGGGDDTIAGSKGSDRLSGGTDVDTISGAGESDNINGGAGNDTLDGGAGADAIYGDLGNDTISEGPADDGDVDRVYGGDGDDSIDVTSGQDAVKDGVECGVGRDEVYVDAADVVAADCEVVTVEPAVADVTFSDPVPVSQAVRLSEQANAEIDSLESDYDVGGHVHDFFVSPPAGDAQSMAQAYEENRLAAFSDMIDNSATLKPEDQAELAPQINAMKAAVARNDAGEITVSGVTLSGEEATLETLNSAASAASAGVAIESAEVRDVSTLEAQGQAEAGAEPLVGPPGPDEFAAEQNGLPYSGFDEPASDVTAAASTWYPNYGRSVVLESSVKPGYRYTGQYHRWDGNTMTYNNTYEHDFFLGNYDGKTYLTSVMGIVPNCKPRSDFVMTTYPAAAKAYLDTNYNGRYACERREIAYTIGAAISGALQSGKTYYNYIRTFAGNTSQDHARLYAQRGFRKPYNCFSAFCSFGYDYEGDGTPINLLDSPGNPYWYGVPSNLSWRE